MTAPPSPPGRLARAATFLTLFMCVHVILLFAPMPEFSLWIVKLVARELSLALPAAAALVLLLARGLRPRLIAIAAGAVGLAPLVLAQPLFEREHLRFSAREYLTGAPGGEGRIERDVVLEPTRPDLGADVYHGEGTGPRPFVIVIHGGSWQRGDKGEVAQISRSLARGGTTVVDVRYRLAPAHRFPAPIQDVKCLLGRLREQAGRLRIDPRRGALLGRSAGGQIALIAAYSVGDAALAPACAVADQPVQAVVAVYAPTDLVYGYEHPAQPDVVRGPESLERYLGGPPRDHADAYRQGSATAYAQRALPRTLLIHGGGDSLVLAEHSQRLNGALTSAGRSVKWLEIPLAEHGFDFRSGGIAEQLERAVVAKFLAEP